MRFKSVRIPFLWWNVSFDCISRGNLQGVMLLLGNLREWGGYRWLEELWELESTWGKRWKNDRWIKRVHVYYTLFSLLFQPKVKEGLEILVERGGGHRFNKTHVEKWKKYCPETLMISQSGAFKSYCVLLRIASFIYPMPGTSCGC